MIISGEVGAAMTEVKRAKERKAEEKSMMMMKKKEEEGRQKDADDENQIGERKPSQIYRNGVVYRRRFRQERKNAIE